MRPVGVMEYFANRSGDGHKAVLVSEYRTPWEDKHLHVFQVCIYIPTCTTKSFCVYLCVIYIFGYEIYFYQHTSAEDISRSVTVSTVS